MAWSCVITSDPLGTTSPDEAQGTLRDWLVVLLLTGAMIFSFVDRFTLSLLLEPIKADLGISDAQLGLLNGVAFGLFYAAMGLPLGWLADRWSRKGTIIVGVGIWTAATAACGLAGNFVQLLLARIGVGAGEAGLAPSSYGLIHDRFPKKLLGRAMSVFQVGSMIGSGVALLVAGAAYQFFVAHAGHPIPLIGGLKPWQQTFVAVALPGVIFVALLALMKEPRTVHSAERPSQGSLLDALKGNASGYALLFFGMSGITITLYALLSWVAAIMEREHHWTPGQVGGTYGLLVLILSPIGLLAGGVINDRLTARGHRNAPAMIAAWSAGLSFPVMLGIGMVSDVTALLCLLGLLHILLGGPIGIVPAYIQLITTPEVRARVSAAYVLIVNIVGLGIGPTLIGGLSSLSPDDPGALRIALVSVTAPALALAAFLLLMLARRDRRA